MTDEINKLKQVVTLLFEELIRFERSVDGDNASYDYIIEINKILDNIVPAYELLTENDEHVCYLIDILEIEGKKYKLRRRQ
jgi:hypothetical protein